MIFTFATAARFPAPEFENYKLPAMNLEAFVGDSIFWRVGVLLLFLILSGICFYRFRSRKAMLGIAFTGLIVFGFIFNACPCPVGVFQNVVDSAVNGLPISVGYLLLFAVPLAFALFWGRLFCAGACPLGAVQEIFHWKTLHVPVALDRVLRMIPILILIIFSVAAAAEAIYPLCYIDPYLPLFLLSFAMPFALITFVFLLLGLFISRPFCRYLCPYGVLLRFFAVFTATKPKITNETCINCKLCEQGCPNGAILSPEDDDSTETHIRGTRRLSLLVACLPLALFIGGIIGYTAAPLLATVHPDVRLLRDVRERRRTLDTEAFEASGASISRLETKALRARNITTVGMSLGGIVFATCLMAELIAVARRRKTEKTYEIDSGLCFCCGRCYQTCPLEKSHTAKGVET
jgi:ferredoxin